MFKKKENSMQKLYGVTLLLMYINYFLDAITLFEIPTMVMTLFEIALVILFLIKMLTQKYTKKTLMLTMVFGLISTAISMVTGEKFFMLIYLLLFSAQGTELRKNIKISLAMKTIFLGLAFLMFGAELITSGTTFEELSVTKYAINFAHYNFAAFIFFWAVVEYFYLYQNKFGIGKILGSVAALTTIMFLTKSRTGMIMSAIFILLLVLFKLKKKVINKILLTVAKVIFPMMAILSVSMTLAFGNSYMDNEFWLQLDDILSRRLSLSHTGMQEYGMTVWPKKIESEELIYFEYVGYGYGYSMPLAIDIFYVKSLISYTIAPLIGIAYLIFRRIMERKEVAFAIVVILFSVYALSEELGFSACATPLFMILADGLLEGKTKESRRKADKEQNGR